MSQNREEECVRNIRKIALALAVFVSGLMIGCADTTSKASDKVVFSKFSMEHVDTDLVSWVGDFYIYADQETGVEYIVLQKNENMLCITPRYKADGSLYTKEKR